MKNLLSTLFALVAFLNVSFAQDDPVKPGVYKVGDKVEAEYVMGWYKGVIKEVQYEGTQYNIELYPPDGSKPFLYPFDYRKVRTPSTPTTNNSIAPTPKASSSDVMKPGVFKVGDKVEADYAMGWYPGIIVEVQYDGTQYNVELYPPHGGKSFKYPFHFKSVRPATRSVPLPQKSEHTLLYGRYGCTASTFRGGEVSYTPRGSFVIEKNGKYSYYGFKEPSNGTFVVDKEGNLLFKGGYMDGGKAEKIDRPNKFFVVFPANPDNRWTCGYVDK